MEAVDPGWDRSALRQHLVPFLPGHPLDAVGGDEAIDPVSAAPFGSALIHLISYAYIRLLGPQGLKRSTEVAILNANYLRASSRGITTSCSRAMPATWPTR